jgi:hypothetical protein
MREDDPLWWTAGAWKHTGRILMCFAPDIFVACQRLRAAPCYVHQCSTPYLLKLAGERGDDEVWEQHVETFPSVYDQFRRPGFTGWDYQAMEDMGFDVS